MLRQTNLVAPSHALFDLSRHKRHGDIISPPLGRLILIRGSKTLQLVGRASVLLIPEVPGHPADPVAAYRVLITASPTPSPNQPILTMREGDSQVTVLVTVSMLSSALHILHTYHHFSTWRVPPRQAQGV